MQQNTTAKTTEEYSMQNKLPRRSVSVSHKSHTPATNSGSHMYTLSTAM